MIPRTLSASALGVAQTCLARYNAEYIQRSRTPGGAPALMGTSIHAGLEFYVQKAIMEKAIDPTWSNLSAAYEVAYQEIFQTSDITSDLFADGKDLTRKWWERTTFDDFTVLSVERKETFDIPTSAGTIPYTYIWDRCDEVEPGVIRVVDYKTGWRSISSEDMRKRIQPRSYALAAQIKWPEAKKIWIIYDMLRYEQVGTVFTREDNVSTWRYLKREAERIIATDENDPPEMLNADCGYCPISASCKALQRNVDTGGIHSLTPDQVAARKLEVEYQLKGLKVLGDLLDERLEAEAEHLDLFSWKTESGIGVEFTTRKTRKADKAAIQEIVGPVLTAKYGKFNITDIDRMLRAEPLTDEQRNKIKKAIFYERSEPTPKVTAPSYIEDD